MFRRLLDAVLRRTAPRRESPPAVEGTHYTEQRETDRVGRLSPEDRKWEADSLQRNRDNRARDDAARPPRP